jgi:hypothetical protein
MAATVALESEFPFIKVISPESMVGYSEQVGGCHKWWWWGRGRGQGGVHDPTELL